MKEFLPIYISLNIFILIMSSLNFISAYRSKELKTFMFGSEAWPFQLLVNGMFVLVNTTGTICFTARFISDHV